MIKLIINYDFEKISKTLEDFYKATDINMNLLKADFSFVSGRAHRERNFYCDSIQNTSFGKKACTHSDIVLLEKCKETKRAQMHICHAGLIDAAAPIIYNDVIIGYVIFGEMKLNTDFSSLEKYISDMGLDFAEMEKYYEEIPLFDSEKIQSVFNIAIMLAKHILLENMLKPDFDESIQRAEDFIKENLSGNLSIRAISENINVSKSVLYKKFHDTFGCTVSEYINAKRVEKAVELLETTNFSMEEISSEVGFSSTPYFGKVFKKIKGSSPLQYKIKHKNSAGGILTKKGR